MGAFNYEALSDDGKHQKGVLIADTERQVRQKLRDQGLTPLEVTTVSKRATRKFRSFTLTTKRVSHADLALITRQMATLLSAGIPLDEVLTGVANQTDKSHIKSILLGVRSKVMEGHPLATGMNDFPGVFPRLYRATVASGEKSGKLDQVLLKLAEYIEKQHYIYRKIRQALIYPSMMTMVSISIVIFLLIYVVPKIINVFSQTNQTLPTATIILITISHFIKKCGLYLLGLMVVGGYAFKRCLKKTNFREKYDRFLLKLPILGKNIRTINSARFARTFGILNAASVPVLEAMKTASQLITPLPMRNAVEAAIEQVREGTSIHLALQKTNYFSPMFVHLVASGETSGQLETMLQKAAINQESDVEALIEGSLTLFEPIMILVMGGVVLFIVLAIMLPIFALDQIG